MKGAALKLFSSLSFYFIFWNGNNSSFFHSMGTACKFREVWNIWCVMLQSWLAQDLRILQTNTIGPGLFFYVGRFDFKTIDFSMTMGFTVNTSALIQFFDSSLKSYSSNLRWKPFYICFTLKCFILILFTVFLFKFLPF